MKFCEIIVIDKKIFWSKYHCFIFYFCLSAYILLIRQYTYMWIQGDDCRAPRACTPVDLCTLWVPDPLILFIIMITLDIDFAFIFSIIISSIIIDNDTHFITPCPEVKRLLVAFSYIPQWGPGTHRVHRFTAVQVLGALQSSS